MDLFGGTINQLGQSLDYATAKNNAISNNISNADTPGYKSQNVVFKDVLNDAISSNLQAKRTNDKHLSFNSDQSSSYRIVTNSNTTYNHNGNNVDVDKEMTELAKNQIYYNAVVDRINGKFSSLQTVIRGGN
ncbi:flagellar basal body rod protein FlgB [Oceanobacillus massiliensis]|uniref:flagellar basal body rod protein FlgB n=1 Tax=Oceanobacillus massiliensis TaxID=1465765 RepID=UPI00028927FA|nr:flagellar basal body rod protein FlgB [Oceanobacillus massiliensis]